ncbi:MAG: hypothetical protein HY730_05720 [Candidatus Tectomicrobia bacterium]|uniref:DUF4286 family protein n=1 Tax=Tectimicrobiota bacterium TaxID=2528274 RepID=A0A933LR09_UNCTE|nr:hypothetical protein [Candidatus Tectomicrobia bacterium]
MSKKRGNGLICVWTDVNPAMKEEFNAWYNEEHIPERVKEVPGILSARRYLCVEGGPQYLAVYDIKDPSVLESKEYQEISQRYSPRTQKVIPHFLNTVRTIYREIFEAGAPPRQDAECLLSIRINMAPQHEEQFNAWYSEDHLPALAGVEGVHYARRFKAVENAHTLQVPPGADSKDYISLLNAAEKSHRYLALYEMDSPEVMQTGAWEKARDYGRTALIRPLFKDIERDVYKLIFSMSK